MKLTWEEKLSALNALAECGLMMRNPGNWYVSQQTEVIVQGERGILSGRYGNGPDPQAAVDDHWAGLTAGDVEVVVIRATSPGERREVLWNGFMWEDKPLNREAGHGRKLG